MRVFYACTFRARVLVCRACVLLCLVVCVSVCFCVVFFFLTHSISFCRDQLQTEVGFLRQQVTLLQEENHLLKKNLILRMYLFSLLLSRIYALFIPLLNANQSLCMLILFFHAGDMVDEFEAQKNAAGTSAAAAATGTKQNATSERYKNITLLCFSIMSVYTHLPHLIDYFRYQ